MFMAIALALSACAHCSSAVVLLH